MKELIWGKTLRSRLIRYNFFIICVIAIHDLDTGIANMNQRAQEARED